jgi:hypothetical protein
MYYTIKGLLQQLFPPVSSGCTIVVIESAAKFNSSFVKNRYKIFTAVLIKKPMQIPIYSGF